MHARPSGVPPKPDPTGLVPRRSTAMAAALVGLMQLAGCSDIAHNNLGGDDAGDDFVGEDESSEGTDPTTAAGTDADDTSDTSDTDTDTGPSEDDGLPEEGPADPHLLTPACDPAQGQVIGFDLAEAGFEHAPELVREAVMSGAPVPAIPISPRPFFNHYTFDHAPAAETTLALDGELWMPQAMLNEASPHFQLHFAVSGPALSDAQRPPLDLVVVGDLGPSMAGLPLELADHALDTMLAALRPGDRITLVGAGDEAELLGTIVVEQGVAPTLPSMLAEVLPASASNLDPALELAYDTLAELEPLADAQAGVVVLSAGHFVADAAALERVDAESELGVALVTLGLGPSELFIEGSMRTLALAGRGVSLYAANPEQIDVDLGEHLTNKLVTSAYDVSVELELPAGLAVDASDPTWGDTLLALEAGRLGPNDSLVFQHQLEACGELSDDAMIRVELGWREPGKDEPQSLAWELPLDELGYGTLATRKGMAVLAYTKALVAYRDMVGPDARYGALLDALSQISGALEAMPNDPDLIEMSEVLAKLEGV